MNLFKSPLPRTEDEFGIFVDKLVKKYGFKNRDHVAVVVAERITHLPPTQAYERMGYFADCVKKREAYNTANHVGQNTQHKVQVDYLASVLKADMNDNQAFDKLQQAVNDGSPYAKKVLDELTQPKLTVVTPIAEDTGTDSVTSEPVPV